MSYRLEKFASTLQQALGEILSRESLNPEFRMASILRVLPAPDLKRVTVFVSCPSDRAAAVLEQLQRSRGFIKKQLAQKMILRYMPELDFTLDTTALIEGRLDQLRPHEDPLRRDGNDHEAADR